jgi:long-subunit acyl-CoA synthetase (AMP-forming)
MSTKEVKAMLGTRLSVVSTGGGPCSAEVVDFCNQILGLGLVNLYGSRETGGIARDGIVYEQVDIIMKPLQNEISDAAAWVVPMIPGERSTLSMNRIVDILVDFRPHRGPQTVGSLLCGQVCVSSPRLVNGYLDRTSTQEKFFIYEGVSF